jgi:hypothetical protein
MQTTEINSSDNTKKQSTLFKIYWPFFLAAFLLVVLLVWQIPAVQNTVVSWINPNAGQVSVRSDFDAFIPYTMGYFPDDFSIKDVGVGGHTAPNYDQYQEWYISDTQFVILLETKGADTVLPEGEAIIIQDGPAVLIADPDLDEIASEFVHLAQFDTSESYQIVFFKGEVMLEVITNLPRVEAVKVADLLIPSQCTKPPTPAP